MKKLTGLAAVAAAVFVAACGGGGSDPGGTTTTDNSGARGSLQFNPPLRVTALTASAFQGNLSASASGQSLLAVAGAPKCGVSFYYLQYGTVGGAGEATNATGALIVPTGTDPACSGARPMVLYAHGTTTDKAYNIANIIDSKNAAYSESALVAATYAAQGFIVIAPNYAGYDTSRLPYHPYLNADQQSKEMIDVLAAARKALPNVGAADSGKLFITGYSQGGHVAMATHKALQAAGQTVTAAAPMSGPYALAALGDAVYYGNVNLGSTVFTPLLSTSFQKAYGNIYSNLTDIYNPVYATGIDTLLPSTTPITTLFQQGKLPQTALFNSTPPTAPAGSPPSLQPTLNAITPPTTPPALAPLFALGFGTSYLINNNARLGYLLDAIANPDGAVPTVTTVVAAAAPAHPMRQAFKKNDLRNWTPTRPVLLCGGNGDPTVFYSVNTLVMQGFWTAPSPAAMPAGLLSVLDVDSAPSGASDPYAAAKVGFATAKSQTAAAAVAAGATDGGVSAVTQAYHGSLVPPFCNAAARGFFQQVLAAGL
ncbi:alpha/beta hydrolase family protein [Variovorax terrae]|uniref:Alpha/beta hydrolase n=1 Tax=Variovorax terrae TaxID=2923278 RepID=A0A9X1W197_9BURK|nr:alpha/beta hydrolase [Variovorax terrae]MCJ0765872.1 alpha/beta hydrolase [Variovorax terrae]